MQKNTKSKLALKTNTLRSLTEHALTTAAGGMIVKTNQSVNRGDCTTDCPTGGFCND